MAEQIGAHYKSYDNWEQDKHEPEARYWPAILSFLGTDPRPEPETLAERIRAKRLTQGITLRELARRLGVDPSTVTAWENGTVEKPYPRFVRLFEEYVEGV